MATSETTNLQLVKYGAGTDNFIRTDYNGNLEKIDTFAGNTNEAIAKLQFAGNLGSQSNISGLQTALLAAAQQLEAYEVNPISFYAGASYSGFVNGSRYQGLLNIISKASNSLYFSIIFESSKNDNPVVGNYNNGTWTWQELALKSAIPQFYHGSKTTSSINGNTDGSVVVDNPSGATSILALIPIGAKPNTSWNTTVSFNQATPSTRTISFRTIGSTAQTYDIRYCIVYT